MVCVLVSHNFQHVFDYIRSLTCNTVLFFFLQMELSKSVHEMTLDDAGSDNEDAGSDSDAWVVL